MFQKSIKNTVGYDVLGNNKPKEKVGLLKVPVMFIKGDKAELIDDQQFQNMVRDYESDFKKYRVMADTDHAGDRGEEDLMSVVSFCKRFYKMGKEMEYGVIDIENQVEEKEEK